ncbi:hypothetical protein GA0061098_1005208 [Bradyrhizobium shewense]|uniref:Uncharacterized protein n=1 Tax=Bradyrhizobium shewense TaxID=1761772 RepID=A0A1C3VT51_9BRAD|nr:hypothetical protein GA0061098_1005208 [Bradyrhizobium shewense]
MLGNERFARIANGAGSYIGATKPRCSEGLQCLYAKMLCNGVTERLIPPIPGMKRSAVMQGKKLTVDGMSHIAAVSLTAASRWRSTVRHWFMNRRELRTLLR